MAATNYILNPPSIFVDDSDPTILYSGTWTIATEKEIVGAPFTDRTPLLNTLHVLRVFNGSFSYAFSGVGVSIFATPADKSNYTCQCFLDGVPLNLVSNSNNTQVQPVCSAFDLPESMVHTITVFVSVPPRDQQPDAGSLSGFGFDYILVQPESFVSPWHSDHYDILLQAPSALIANILPASQPNNSLVSIDNEPGDIVGNITLMWQFDIQNGFHTTTAGSQFNVTFTGISLWWYGYVNRSLVSNHRPFSAAFAIDDGEPSTFDVPGITTATWEQAYFFRTPVTQSATHRLSVVYHGNDSSIPLTMQSLIIQRSRPGALGPSSTAGPVPSSAVPDPPQVKPTSKHNNQGGITAGTICLFLVVCTLLVLMRKMLRKRRAMQRRAESTAVVSDPFLGLSDDVTHIAVPRKARAAQENINNALMEQQLPEPPETKWSRRSQVMNNLGHISSSESARVIQEHGRSEFPISNPFSADDSQHYPTNDFNIHSARHSHNGLHPTTANNIYSRNRPEGSDERDEGGRSQMGSVTGPPPAYTTY